MILKQNSPLALQDIVGNQLEMKFLNIERPQMTQKVITCSLQCDQAAY